MSGRVCSGVRNRGLKIPVTTGEDGIMSPAPGTIGSLSGPEIDDSSNLKPALLFNP
jgi:hypothetical protein